jgi:flagellar hook-associated protein 3 FlgL
MRIATNTIYQNSLDTIGHQQSSLNDLQGQIATGKRVSSAADDPTAAVETVRLTQSNAKIGQYSSNLDTAKSTLQLQDNTLGNVTTLIQQAQTLVNNAGDPTYDKSARGALAVQIESVRDQLLGAGQGHYLFGGYQTNSAPFSMDDKGQALYSGSLGQRTVQINDTRQMEIGDVGSRIFQGVSPGAGRIVEAPATNAGTATAGTISTVDANNPGYGDDFAIAFHTGKDGAMQYSIHDATTNQEIAKDQAFTPGAAITFAGQRLSVSGQPANGDTIKASSPESAGMDIVATLSAVANSIRTATTGSEGNARLTNALNTASSKLSNSLNNVLTVQASVGAREQEANTLSTQNTDTGVQYQTQLQNLTGSDFVSAYSQFTQTQNSLQAAEKTFMQMQNLSLFDLIK